MEHARSFVFWRAIVLGGKRGVHPPNHGEHRRDANSIEFLADAIWLSDHLGLSLVASPPRLEYHLATLGGASLLGITSLVAYNLLLYFGLSSGEEAPAAATINSLFPLVIIAVSVLVFKERISGWGWFGIA